MGRRKSAGKHRRSTGKKRITTKRPGTGSGDTGGAGTTTGAEVSTGTGETTGATGEREVVAGLAPDHQIVQENTLELLEQLESAPDPIPENLAAEAAAALGQAPVDPVPEPPPGEEPYDPNKVTEWDMYMQMAFDLVAKVVLPQWNLTDDEKAELTKSTAHILEDLFPGGLSGRYAPYLRLITVSGFIVVTRHRANGGKLPGLGPKKEEPVATQ